MLGLTILGILALAMAIPVKESSRNQIIGLIGLVLSGIFAFSSTTIFANLMAGMMLRVTRPFRTGDFVRAKEYFGRVTERGLLDTEIQTENRELIAVPNLFLITNPVTVVQSSGTIVSASLSLGYDVHHSQVETLLLEAAETCGLEEPFVHIMGLGDFSITYKISGMLKEVKSLLTANSNLCREVLDKLHGQGVEIMSPAFMNQRRLADDVKMIPRLAKKEKIEPQRAAEEIVFDKAEQAEERENQKERLRAEIQQLETEVKDASEEDRARIDAKIQAARDQLKSLEETEEPRA